MPKKKQTFEKVLQELEVEVDRLESGELPLDAALACFELGVKAASRCQAMLDEAELKIEQLTKDANGKLESSPLPSTDSPDGA